MKDSLGKVLLEERTKRKLSLRKFSKLLGISHTYLANLEKDDQYKNGKKITPTLEILIKISNALNIDVDIFLQRCGYVNLVNLYKQDTELNLYFSKFIEDLRAFSCLKINETPLPEETTDKLLKDLDVYLSNLLTKYGK
jgi:transcriptional regulator with XRE-family HTH domain